MTARHLRPRQHRGRRTPGWVPNPHAGTWDDALVIRIPQTTATTSTKASA